MMANEEALATAYAQARRSPATTIGVVMTDATLTKAQARKIAAIAHDGMARAIRPVHSMFDGDTVFCLASSRRSVAEDPDSLAVRVQYVAGGGSRCVRDACLDGILAATGRGSWQSYASWRLRSSAEILV